MADDTIYRRAAIDALCDNCDNTQAVCAHFPCKQYIAVEKLPSAQAKLDENDMPEQGDSSELGVKTWETCTDCVSRQAAIDEIARWIGYIDEDMIWRIRTGLKKVPSAQPDVPDTNVGDMINRQDVLALAKDVILINGAKHRCIDATQIHELPSAQPERCEDCRNFNKTRLLIPQPERKKGKWIYLNGLDAFECSVCGRQMVRNIFDYCPWCGAEMTKGEEDE